MTPDEKRDAEMAEWNAALRSGDQTWIEDARQRLLAGVHTRIMNDDPNYLQGGWTPTD